MTVSKTTTAKRKAAIAKAIEQDRLISAMRGTVIEWLKFHIASKPDAKSRKRPKELLKEFLDLEKTGKTTTKMLKARLKE